MLKLLIILNLFFIVLNSAENICDEFANLVNSHVVHRIQLQEFIEKYPDFNWNQKIVCHKNRNRLMEYPIFFLARCGFHLVDEILTNDRTKDKIDVNVKNHKGFPIIYYIASSINNNLESLSLVYMFKLLLDKGAKLTFPIITNPQADFDKKIVISFLEFISGFHTLYKIYNEWLSDHL